MAPFYRLPAAKIICKILYLIYYAHSKKNFNLKFAGNDERQWFIHMDLFDYMRDNTMKKEAPLASRLRPTTLEEVVGQSHIIGKDKLLYRAIKADKLSSIILYGPPGTGKTTIAKVIANTTSSIFTQINATASGKKDMEAVVDKAKNNLGSYGKRTILFIDEIHRFNKGQQD